MSEHSKPRCGLCDIVIPEASWKDHEKSELHQSKLPKHREVKRPVVPVREVSDEERRRNKRERELAAATFLGYYSHANGQSGDWCRCECGEEVFVYRWRGCKRCPNCWKVISTHMSISFALGDNKDD